MTLHCIYSLSDNGYSKEKFAFATKQYCLNNFIQRFGLNSEIHLLVDNTNLKPETKEFANQVSVDTVEFYDGGSSAASWRKAVDYVTKNLSDDDYFYRCEDDYLHKFNSYEVLMEGLKISDYVSLYDHNDKYIDAKDGGNQFITDGGEITRVIRTDNSHWKLTNSTTMTVATSMQVFKEDRHIWDYHTLGTYPGDFQAFIELMKKGRSLITPIPGFSTHCEPRWASPGINWETA